MAAARRGSGASMLAQTGIKVRMRAVRQGVHTQVLRQGAPAGFALHQAGHSV